MIVHYGISDCMVHCVKPTEKEDIYDDDYFFYEFLESKDLAVKNGSPCSSNGFCQKGFCVNKTTIDNSTTVNAINTTITTINTIDTTDINTVTTDINTDTTDINTDTTTIKVEN
ncbi:uncharacterized protein LOC122499961 [Leptopilina heterotoma]|uniref:uncharacterized protein LOC122499961 n=1 Tax=Leptopilina heterotoma TaxID=63436 RepID=UPI001CA8E2FC|nr:uncharacterized protein LOC122499961 [Leptopilina heterotoma]